MPAAKFFRKDLKFRMEPLKQVQSLQNKHAKDLENARGERGESGEGIKDPYKNMTFLYIRATETDDGARPISGTIWLSPDVNVYPNTGGPEIWWGIEAGQRYTIEIIVHNDGDTDVPSGTVEARLANPSVGWTVSDAKLLGIVRVVIPAFSSKVVSFEWTADSEDVGHRCLFARVYSMSPLDVPNDWESLDVSQDRHIGQQNLSIVQEESEVNVDVSANNQAAGDKKGEFKVIVRPAKQIPEKLRTIAGLKDLSLKAGTTTAKFSIGPRKATTGELPDMDIKPGQEANTWLGKIKGGVGARVSLRVPKLALKKDEGAVYDVVSVDPRSNKELGGFTLTVLKRM